MKLDLPSVFYFLVDRTEAKTVKTNDWTLKKQSKTLRSYKEDMFDTSFSRWAQKTNPFKPMFQLLWIALLLKIHFYWTI